MDKISDLSEPEAARALVRTFLADEIAARTFVPELSTWTTYNVDFTRRAAAAGFVGMTIPKEFGGRGLSSLVRYAITEEMLAAGAPCGAHWIADRQSAPQILRHGSEEAKRSILPRIARGECYFGIGMSEPESGSDLAAVRTKATKTDGGWLISGSKIWTTNAHRAHHLLTLVRTSDDGANRHGGLTQFIVDMSSPQVSTRPIRDISGEHEFNEVYFDKCFVADEMVIGNPGEGWKMVTEELAFERSGPDRFLSSHRLFAALIDQARSCKNTRSEVEIGRLVAHLATLRAMSRDVAGKLQRNELPDVDAALVKIAGTTYEREIPEIARCVIDLGDGQEKSDRFLAAFEFITLRAPSFTLRGGTQEILRGVVARGVGLR